MTKKVLIDLRYKKKLKNKLGIRFIRMEVVGISPMAAVFCKIKNGVDAQFSFDLAKPRSDINSTYFDKEENEFLAIMVPQLIEYYQDYWSKNFWRKVKRF